MAALDNSLRFATLDGPPLRIPYEEIDRLESRLRGALLGPGMVGYDEARGGGDHRPALIVQPATTADLARMIRFALRHGLAVSVGVGNRVTLECDGGLLLDLSKLHA